MNINNCHHPFSSLRSGPTPGITHCWGCGTDITCPHPYHCLKITADGEVTCEACRTLLQVPVEEAARVFLRLMQPSPSRSVH